MSEIESVIDEFFARTHLKECESPIKGTKLFGHPPDYIFLVEQRRPDEYTVIQEMPIIKAYTGEIVAKGKKYNKQN